MMIRNRLHKVNGMNFTVPRQYTELTTIGRGSFGVVVSAIDIFTNEKVAIKKICRATQTAQETKHALREIRLMQYLGVHDNIITLKGLFIREKCDELYIIMEYADADLHRLIQSKHELTEEHRQFFMVQIFRAVNFIHLHNVIHRDLKPGNILVLKNCRILISDFGLAREKPDGESVDQIGCDESDLCDGSMTQHVATRWYRAPELILVPDGKYDYSIDMWSVGCILAELLGRKTLFPGKDLIDQLTLIVDGIGSPQPQEIMHIKSPGARKFLESVSGKQKSDFRCTFPSCDPRATDLLQKLLVFDPSQRLSASAALSHSYLESARNMGPKLKDLEVKNDCDFKFENQRLEKEDLKLLVLKEVQNFNDIQVTKVFESNSSEDSSGRNPKVHQEERVAGTKRSIVFLSAEDTADKQKLRRVQCDRQLSHAKDLCRSVKHDCFGTKKEMITMNKQRGNCIATKKNIWPKHSQKVSPSQSVMNFKAVPRSPKFSVQ